MARRIFIPVVLLILSRVGNAARLREAGCPDSEDIEPCTCAIYRGPILTCRDLTEADVLRNVFHKSAKYKYDEVKLEASSLQYLPKEMFEGVPVTKLSLTNVSLVQLFDEPPESLSMLDYLRLQSVRVMGGMSWRLLQPLTKLTVLNIIDIPIKTINEDFSRYVNHDLELLVLYGTSTRKIATGTFKEFNKLKRMDIVNNKLTSLSRDMFPTPFDIKILSFGRNRLQSIPDDLFTEMPSLMSVSLDRNNVATLPESVFSGSPNVQEVILKDNPIKCDCDLRWLIKKQEEGDIRLYGKCAYPKPWSGLDLERLTVDSFHC